MCMCLTYSAPHSPLVCLRSEHLPERDTSTSEASHLGRVALYCPLLVILRVPGQSTCRRDLSYYPSRLTSTPRLRSVADRLQYDSMQCVYAVFSRWHILPSSHHSKHTTCDSRQLSHQQTIRTVCRTRLSQTASSKRFIDNQCALVSRRHTLLGILSSLTLSSNSQSAWAGLIDEKQADKVFESANQSVVSIADYKVANGQETSEGTGSGFMWDTYGHIVTNYHCVSKFATDRVGAQVRPQTVLLTGKGCVFQPHSTTKHLVICL